MVSGSSAISAPALRRVVRLWDELADYPAGHTDAALEHLLTVLCELTSAQSAHWIGAVRLPKRRRNDPLRGWRPRAVRCLHESPEDSDLYRQLLRQIDQGIVDESIRAQVQHAGTFRAALLKHLVAPAWFTSSACKQMYAARDISDTLLVVFPVTREAESHFALHRMGRSRPFGTRERDLAAHALRGLKWFHRQVLLSHGLLAARAPLTPAERRVQQLLLTESSEQEIARALNLSRATAHTYITNLFRRFGVHGRAGLAALWLGGTTTTPPRWGIPAD